MIDIKLFRQNFDVLKEKLTTKKIDLLLLKKLSDLDKSLRAMKQYEANLNNERNNLAKKVTHFYSLNQQEKAVQLQEEIKNIKIELNKHSILCQQTEQEYEDLLSYIPNLPDDTVPIGESENENKLDFEWGKIPNFNFTLLSHFDLASKLKIVDFELGPKISGTRFVVYQNEGVTLLNALAQYTLKIALENGYTQYAIPVIVDKKSLIHTGHLPKFVDDLFETNDGKFLSPTAEVQLVNLYAKSIIDSNKLPIKITANSLCFRKEAGAAGRDTRGLIRLHQFLKTELVIFCKAEESYKELTKLVLNAQKVLEGLNLAYRRIELCTGDLGFAAAKTYDLEVWLPSENKYREISSCSNTTDFQARQALIRHRLNSVQKAEYVHILNGSGVAIDRLFAAVIENNQQPDGSVLIPEALHPYMNGITRIIIKN